MPTKVKSVSKILLKPTEKLRIKLSVGILDREGNKSYYTLYDMNRYSYMVSDISSNVVMEYKEKDNKGNWSKDMQLYINQKNIFQLVRGLNSAHRKLQRKDLYIDYDDGSMELGPSDDNDVEYISNLQLSQCLKISPGVIYDKDEKPLAGVYLFINNSQNMIDLSIDEFESVVYLFSTINISLETQTLLNTYILEQINDKMDNVQAGNSTSPKEKPKLSSGRTNVFSNRPPDNIKKTETITGGEMIGALPKSLDDL